jgi:hypothetical protein
MESFAMIRFLLFTYVLLAAPTFAEEANSLTPIMVRPEKVHLEMDFEEAFALKPKHKFLKAGQGTTWQTIEGVLVGTQSSPAYQAKKKAAGNGHLGTAPRLQLPGTPKDVIVKLSLKIVGGKGTKLLPMIEAGHHLRRVYFGSQGSQILVDHEKTVVAENDFVLKTGRWYHIMLEIKDDEFLVRLQDGPTLYGKGSGIGAGFDNYDLGIAANDKGTISIDNLTVWQAGDYLENWETTKQNLVDEN